jgi:hypothetical protein
MSHIVEISKKTKEFNKVESKSFLKSGKEQLTLKNYYDIQVAYVVIIDEESMICNNGADA